MKVAWVVDSIKRVAFWFAFHHSSKCRFDEQLFHFFSPEFECMINDKRKKKKKDENKKKIEKKLSFSLSRSSFVVHRHGMIKIQQKYLMNAN